MLSSHLYYGDIIAGGNPWDIKKKKHKKKKKIEDPEAEVAEILEDRDIKSKGIS